MMQQNEHKRLSNHFAELKHSTASATIEQVSRELAKMNRTDISLIALRKILRATELYGRKLASAAGLTAVQFRVLQIVSENAMMTPKDISKQMGVSQATITSLIDKLEKQGMVCRTKSEADRRQINITLTRAE